MTERQTLAAFLATLAAIVATAILARIGGTGPETLRILDTIAVGLIGVIGTFRPRSADETGVPKKPAETRGTAVVPERPSWEA